MKPTYPSCGLEQICLPLALSSIYVSNAWVIEAFRLIDGINLDNKNKNKKYDATEVLIESNSSDMSNL